MLSGYKDDLDIKECFISYPDVSRVESMMHHAYNDDSPDCRCETGGILGKSSVPFLLGQALTTSQTRASKMMLSTYSRCHIESQAAYRMAGISCLADEKMLVPAAV